MGGSGAEFLFTPSLNKQWDLGFLKQLSKSAPEAVHVVIGDGAGFHHKEADEFLPSNIRIITLPAYCPELNPAEKLWDIVKDGICNKLWEDLDSMEEAITQKIRPYWEDAHSRQVKAVMPVSIGDLRVRLSRVMWRISG